MDNTLTDDEKKEIVEMLAALAEEIGWIMAIPPEHDQGNGILLGTEEWVLSSVKKLYGEDVPIFKTNEDTGEIEEVNSENVKKKTDRLH